VDHLDLIKFCYNYLEHLIIGTTLFQMLISKPPNVHVIWVAIGGDVG
jgi:hypothetical protein